LRGRWKRGAERNALGRSRGGFSTKINARANAEGLPIGIVITPGQAHDVTAFPALMQEIDCDPEQMLGDKGYDSKSVRDEIEQRGGEAAIPSTATRKIQHVIDKALYALRNRIERFFNRAKNSRRVATRYDKLIESFAAFQDADTGRQDAQAAAAPARAQYQLGFFSGGYTGTSGTKPCRFGISTFGRVLASRTSFSWMMPFR
jgi:transposase